MPGSSANLRYYLCCQPTDMRNGFEGLAGIVRNFLGKEPISGDIFIFLNKSGIHYQASLLGWRWVRSDLFRRISRGAIEV